jgi:hypothetical protein
MKKVFYRVVTPEQYPNLTREHRFATAEEIMRVMLYQVQQNYRIVG